MVCIPGNNSSAFMPSNNSPHIKLEQRGGLSLLAVCWPCASHILDRQSLAEDKTQQETGRDRARVGIHRTGHFPTPISHFWRPILLLEVVPRWMKGSTGNYQILGSSQPCLWPDVRLPTSPLCLLIFPACRQM